MTNLQSRDFTLRRFSDIWHYCVSGTEQTLTSVHLPLTLDEFCKPVLGPRLEDRNNDQVYARYMNRKEYQDREIPAGPRRSHNLVTISQAWF